MPGAIRVFPLVLLLLLTACAQQSVRKLYEGADRPASEIAVVRVPIELEIMRINGRRIQGLDTLFSPGHKDLHLAPGRYRILAYYKDLWELSGDGHDVVKTDPALFVVNARAGHSYELGFDEPEDLEQARQLEQQFSGYVLDRTTGEKTPTRGSGLTFQSGIAGQLGEVTTTRQQETRAGSGTSSASTVAPLAEPEKQGGGQAAGPDGEQRSSGQDGDADSDQTDYLGMLKAYWSQATQKERRAFLKWISKKKQGARSKAKGDSN